MGRDLACKTMRSEFGVMDRIDTIREPAEDRGRDHLHQGEGPEDEADDLRRTAHRAHVERQERDDDTEADHVQEDGQEHEEEDA